MSRIKKEIAASITSFAENGHEELVASFIFSDDFVGFQGHFPEKKILPGICQILCAKVMLEERKKSSIYIKEVQKVKYFLPVGPGEEITCRCVTIRNSDDDFSIKATITKGADKVANFSLVLSYEALRRGKANGATEGKILF